MQERDPKTGKPVASSAGKFFGWNTIYGRDGEHGTPYMTRIWFWGLRLHIFHRPDLDEDCHDHPWDFWTLPLWPRHGYVEEVAEDSGWRYHDRGGERLAYPAGAFTGVIPGSKPAYETRLQIVPAFRVSFRPATHCHRVLGAYTGLAVHPYWGDTAPMNTKQFTEHGWQPQVDPTRKLVTLVWRSPAKRAWGFLKNRNGEWCWVAWRDYVFAGGKDGPCQ